MSHVSFYVCYCWFGHMPAYERGFMIALIDYDAGNLLSVYKALKHLGEKPCITNKKEEILAADKIILPGVGAYLDCMNKLREYNLVDTIKEAVDKDIPFLGICLGMQLLFESSSEGEKPGITDSIYCEGRVRGLSLLKGHVKRFKPVPDFKIPHMGWNNIHINGDKRLYKGIHADEYVYFVHSYHCIPDDENIISTTTDYSESFVSSVEHKNIFGCQFHPEKSSDAGLKILSNFIGI